METAKQLNNERPNLAELSRQYGISRATLSTRFHNGITGEDLVKPVVQCDFELKHKQYEKELELLGVGIKLIGKYAGRRIKTLHQCSCGKQWEARPGDIISGKTKTCQRCDFKSFAEWGIKELGANFLEKYWDSDKNVSNPYEVSYGGKEKVWIKCQDVEYHSYETTCCNFVRNKRNCPYCITRNGKVHPNDSLGAKYPEAVKLWGDKNTTDPFAYTPKSNQKAWFKCAEGKHEDVLRVISNTVHSDFRCPKCTEERKESLLQEKVRLYLETLGYTILHENDCTLEIINPRTGHRLPTDNEIKELKLIIEVHGPQHYEFNELLHGSKELFEYSQWRDAYKKEQVLANGYSFLELCYKDIRTVSRYKTIINKKIKEIRRSQNAQSCTGSSSKFIDSDSC